MKTIEVQLDEQTFERAQRLAETRRLRSTSAETGQWIKSFYVGG